jgi:hypothetical protein
MEPELRFRLAAGLRARAASAASVRGISLTALVSVALHDYLSAHSDPAPAAPTAPPTITTPATPERIPRPIPPNIKWKNEHDGGRSCVDPKGEEWAEDELKHVYSKGADPFGYYT